jgi:hypothetical protein
VVCLTSRMLRILTHRLLCVSFVDDKHCVMLRILRINTCKLDLGTVDDTHCVMQLFHIKISV